MYLDKDIESFGLFEAKIVDGVKIGMKMKKNKKQILSLFILHRKIFES